MNLEDKIRTMLDEQKISYEVFEHEPVYMDPDLIKKNFVYFNPGMHDKSFKIKAWDLKKICKPAFVKM